MLQGPDRLLKSRYCPGPLKGHLISRRDAACRVSEDGASPHKR